MAGGPLAERTDFPRSMFEVRDMWNHASAGSRAAAIWRGCRTDRRGGGRGRLLLVAGGRAALCLFCVVGLLGWHPVARAASAAVVSHTAYGDFAAAVRGDLVREDWSAVPDGVIQNQTINGVTYGYTNPWGQQLVVENYTSWGFRLGALRTDGQLTAFGSRCQMEFRFNSQGLDSFGVMFAQGNYSDAGVAVFAVQVGEGEVFMRTVVIDSVGPNIGYLGLTGLGGADTVTIWRVQSDANVVWGVYHIDFAVVPGGGAVAGLLLIRCRKRRRR